MAIFTRHCWKYVVGRQVFSYVLRRKYKMKKRRQTVCTVFCISVCVCVCVCVCKRSENMKGKLMWNVGAKGGFICG